MESITIVEKFISWDEENLPDVEIEVGEAYLVDESESSTSETPYIVCIREELGADVVAYCCEEGKAMLIAKLLNLRAELRWDE